VSVDDQIIGQFGPGLVILVGVAEGDGLEEARAVAEKCANLRIFPDETGKFNLSALDVRAEALVISQFTLYADVRRGRRPSFVRAARPELAEPLVEAVAQELHKCGLHVEQGRFGAHMIVNICNDGPVTIIVDSEDLQRPRRSAG